MVDPSEIEQRLRRSDEELAERLTLETVPGGSNDGVINSARRTSDVLEQFVEETNNWFEIVEVCTYPDGKIGIPARYRWSISRWAESDMDSWLVDKGWDNIPHTFANTNDREENEMEARYVKEFDDGVVYANFLVEFTERVFNALNGTGTVDEKREEMERKKVRNERVRKFLEYKRGE